MVSPKKKYGDDEKTLREQYKNQPEIIKGILENRRKNKGLYSQEEEEVYKLYPSNLKVFVFFYDFCNGIALSRMTNSFDGTNKIIGFDWLQVRAIANIIGFKLSRKRFNKLKIIEAVIRQQLNG